MKTLLQTIGVLLLAGLLLTGCGDDPAAPGAVGGFSVAQGYEVDAIAVSWSAASGATGYEVQRSLFGEGAYTLAGTSTTTNFTDTDVQVGENWHYRVRAVGDGGAGAWTAPIMGYCAGKRIVVLTNNVSWTETQFARLASLALDAQGRPAISYHNYNNGSIQYARPSGRGWTVETVEGDNWSGRCNALVLDGTGNPHLVFNSQGNERISYARKSGSAWIIETVETNVLCSDPVIGLVLDGLGTPHLAYRNDIAGGGVLRYALRTNAAWVVTSVDTNTEAGYDATIIMDAAGRPGIVSFHFLEDTKMFFHNMDGLAWNATEIPVSGGPGRYAGIALDGAGHPCISFIAAGDGDLRYVTHDGSAWGTPQQAAASAFSYTGLAFDGAGMPVIAYSGGAGGTNGLALARYNGSSWERTILDTGADDNCGLFLSFKMDAYGRAHIAYFDSMSTEIRYLCWLP